MSSDDDEFDCLLGGEDRTGTYEDTTEFTYSKQLLAEANVLPKKMTDWMKENKKGANDLKFFKHSKTLQHKGKVVFTRLQHWYVDHCIYRLFKSEPGKKAHLKKLLMTDPVGITSPSKDDEFCWTSKNVIVPDNTTGNTVQPAPGPTTRSATQSTVQTASATAGAAVTTTAVTTSLTTDTEYTQTTFLVTLQHTQRQIYLHLRSTLINRFAGKDAKTLIQGFIEDEEKERVDNGDMTEENRFEVGVRVEWEKIQEFVLEKLCVIRMGSHYFISLFTNMRKDNQTVISWVKTVEKIHAVVAKQSSHWKSIVDEEALPALAIWLTEAEEKVVMEEIFRKNMHNTYKKFDDMTRTMTLLQFRQLAQKIDVKKWPSRFSQKRHHKALSQTLVTYATLQSAVKLAEEKLKTDNDELRLKLKRSNEKVKHLEKKITVLNEKLKANGALPHPQRVKPTRIPGAHGTVPKGGCQLCWDDGLGFRDHGKDPCDPNKRKAAVLAKLQREEKAKAKAKNKGKATKAVVIDKATELRHPVPKGLDLAFKVTSNRKHPLDSYQASDKSCNICKWEDVPPKGCIHPEDTCFRRKDGPLKDVKDPADRVTESMKLANKIKDERAKKRAATKAARKKKKETKQKKKVGFTSAVRAAPAPKTVGTTEDTREKLKGIPTGRLTEEEIAKFNEKDWSEPSSTFKTRYLLNKIAKECPLTYEELDMLMLPVNRTIKRKVDLVKKKFHSMDGEHELYSFRRDYQEYLQNNGYLGYRPKRYRKGTRKSRKRSEPESCQTSYVPSAPAYGPPQKASRLNVTRPKTNATRKKKKSKSNEPPPILVEYKDKVSGPKLNFEVVKPASRDSDGSASPQYRPNTPPQESEKGTTNAGRTTTASPQYEPTSPTEGCNQYTVSSGTGSDASSTDSDDSGDEVSTGTCNMSTSMRVTQRTNTHISPEQVAAHVNPIKIERPVRRGAVLDLLSGIMEIPDGLWCPATARVRPVGISYPNRKQKPAIESSLDSETKGSRLLQAYMEYRAPDGSIQKGRVQIDTQSNINYTLSKHALPRSRRVWEAEYAIGISGKTIKLGRPNSFTIMKNGKPVSIDSVKADPVMFTQGCIALLGVDAIATLGIDVNYHMDSARHIDIKYRADVNSQGVQTNVNPKASTPGEEPKSNDNGASARHKRKRDEPIRIERDKKPAKNRKVVDLKYREDSEDNKVCNRVKEQAMAKYPAYELWKHLKYRDDATDNKECSRAKKKAVSHYPEYKQLERAIIKRTYLSERICADYLQENPDDYASDDIPLESINIGPDVPAEIRTLLIALLHKYRKVFSSKTNELPKAMQGVTPHKFKLKPDAVPSRVGRPHFGKSQAKIINDWLDWALEQGLVEPAPKASWSSRLVLAPKYKNTTSKTKVPDGIRITWAGTGANEQIQKTVPTYPDAWQQIYKVANYKYKFSADGLKQYWSIPLHQDSREVTAFWTPKGLFKFTRLVMGTKNAATVAQNAYTHALNALLNKKSYDHISNYADDFLGGANTYESLLFHFEQFLIMCEKASITINPSKVRIGHTQETWYGYNIDQGKITPSDRNLDPINRMVNPTNKSELRSILGIFNQLAHFIPNYRKDKDCPARILHELMSEKVDFVFTSRHEKALKDLKKIALGGDLCLFAPDHNHPLILETDASVDGWGAILYQKIDGEKRVIKMWSKAWETTAWVRKPTYHREAKAWMNGLTLTIPYATHNRYPVECWTDHTPLTWVKHTSGKGPVSQFIVDTLSVIDYNMNYIKGPVNVPADTLSRFPLLGPAKLRQSGIKEAVDILLAALMETDVDTHKVWFHAGKSTQHLVTDVYDWRHKVNELQGNEPLKRQQCYMDNFSAANVKKIKYTMGIWAPNADKITAQCMEAYRKGTPFACLVPSDLVHRIPYDESGDLDKDVERKINNSFLITLLSPGLTWVIHGIDFSKIKQPIRRVHQSSSRVTPEFELQELVKTLMASNMTPPLPNARTREEWVKLQKDNLTKLLWEDIDGVKQDPDGLWTFEGKTIVPAPLQVPLTKWKHASACHVGSQKIYTMLKQRFHWKHMRRTCKHVNDTCALCNLLKARMRHAHKHFRPKLFCTPRTAYGADYYGVLQNKQGYNNILGIIDLSNGHLVLKPLKSRSAANTAHTLFYDIVVRKGVPLLFHSDAAKEFLSTAMKALSATLGIAQTSTLAHNPKSNAKIERVWQFVGRCLRTMTPDEYREFHKYVPIMEHVWNTIPDSDTNITPFQAEHGMRCRTIAESILQQPPAAGLPASADDLKTIAISVNAFREHIHNVKAVEASQTAIRLNADGTSKVKFNVGDEVAFYLPPSDETVKAMGKKKKHILQYVGPGVIVQVLSPNNTSFRIKYKNRHYERNVMHMLKYKSPDEVPAELQMYVDNTVSVGSYVAVLDDNEDRHYHIAQVIDITDENTTIHYLGAGGRNLRSAQWKKLYHLPGSNEISTAEPQTIVRNWMRFTGTIRTGAGEDSLIILANIGFTGPDTMRINARTRKILSRTNYRHHVMGRTWM